eukprot:gene14611-14735_t
MSAGVGIASIGELLVELMRADKNSHHLTPGQYQGPFPSGAPGIFIDQAAKIGGRCIFVGAVGDDAFGRVILARLRNDGVDTSLIRTVAGVPTGTAFVGYNDDGSRDFVYNIALSAATQFGSESKIAESDITRLAGFGLDFLHVSGAALGDAGMCSKILEICRALHAKGIRISFDPNVRKELIGSAGYFDAVREIMAMCRVFLPSDDDVEALFPGETLGHFAPKLFAQGIEYVVLKRGTEGCAVRNAAGEQIELPAHRVDVLDPTGAGDCFCATFVTLLATGRYSLEQVLQRANAAGALAVTKVGPMEGNSDLATVEAFLEQRQACGIPSWCTAHPETLRAILRAYHDCDAPVLIEATCNQVNQYGGYTGMTPPAFRSFVETLARECSIDPRRIILGGDHLGPNPWKALPADEAMAHARALVKAYVEAGFTKIHLDASMACADDVQLGEAEIARRAAELCAVAEAVGAPNLSYIIGTEVPIPGGETEILDSLAATNPDSVRETWALHSQAFAKLGLDAAQDKIIGMVVQPGVDFGNAQVFVFNAQKAAALSASVKTMPNVVFEAHSTDYQPESALAALVASHFAILKVGPELTFGYREAIFAMVAIARYLGFDSSVIDVISRQMDANPKDWRAYIAEGADQDLLKLFGLSDRMRYYWPNPAIQAAVKQLCTYIDSAKIPPGLLWQYAGQVSESALPLSTRIIDAKVQKIVHRYRRACEDQG